MLIEILIGFVASIILASFVEHFIHKSLLHSTPKIFRKISFVKGMWSGHSISHHGHYLPDDHYTRDETNKEEVLAFAWYHGPLIILGSTLIAYILDLFIRFLLGIPARFFLPEIIGVGMAFTLYYTAYESLHAIMHVPNKWKWLLGTMAMRWLNRHHYQHHVDPRTNLNVIFPLADYVWRTRKPLPKEQYKYADLSTSSILN